MVTPPATKKCCAHTCPRKRRQLAKIATRACHAKRHPNVQKCPEHLNLFRFWLRHVLRATTACNFSSLIWPDGSASAALASLLFDPPEPQIIGTTQVFRDFPTFSRTCIFFVLTLSLLSSSLLFSSLTLATSAFPSVHIVGSLTSKLPSATHPRNLTWNLRIGPGWSSHWTWQFLGYHV